MYTPQPFKPDRAASLAFAEARGFGLACAWDGGKPVASALPFYLSYAADGTPRALFHVARHNPLVKLWVERPGCWPSPAPMPMCRPTGMCRPTRCRPGSIRPCI